MPKSLSPENAAAISDALFRGNKIEAIKLHRQATGFGLKESKDEIEKLEASLRAASPEKFVARAKGGGCVGSAAALCICGGALVCWWLGA